MKFRYLLIDEDGDVTGTQDRTRVDWILEHEDLTVVVDCEQGLRLDTDEEIEEDSRELTDDSDEESDE